MILVVNEKRHRIDVDPDTPLAWVLRDTIGLKGTHVTCAVGYCGACTVHIDEVPERSCSIAVSDAVGKRITTIEGLGAKRLHPVQQAWIDEDVVQCGYCQSGFVMAAAALINNNPAPTDAEIDTHLTNICRCATYVRVRKAIHRAAQIKAGKAG